MAKLNIRGVSQSRLCQIYTIVHSFYFVRLEDTDCRYIQSIFKTPNPCMFWAVINSWHRKMKYYFSFDRESHRSFSHPPAPGLEVRDNLKDADLVYLCVQCMGRNESYRIRIVMLTYTLLRCWTKQVRDFCALLFLCATQCYLIHGNYIILDFIVVSIVSNTYQHGSAKVKMIQHVRASCHLTLMWCISCLIWILGWDNTQESISKHKTLRYQWGIPEQFYLMGVVG